MKIATLAGLSLSLSLAGFCIADDDGPAKFQLPTTNHMPQSTIPDPNAVDPAPSAFTFPSAASRLGFVNPEFITLYVGAQQDPVSYDYSNITYPDYLIYSGY